MILVEAVLIEREPGRYRSPFWICRPARVECHHWSQTNSLLYKSGHTIEIETLATGLLLE